MWKDKRGLIQTDWVPFFLLILATLVASMINTSVADWPWWSRLGLTLSLWLGLIGAGAALWGWLARKRPAP